MRKRSRAIGPQPAAAPSPPRLSRISALRTVAGMAFEDDARYADLEISGTITGRAAKRVTFERVILRDLDLTSVRCERLRLIDVRFHACDLANAAWREASIDRTELIGCRLTGLDLADTTAGDLVFRQCTGSLVSFRFAQLKRALFEDCVLSEADFQNTALPGAVFRGCDLKGSGWFGADLGGADLRGSDLDNPGIRAGDFAGAIIDSTQLVTVARRLASMTGIVVRDRDE